jgi:hypothetical protein
MTKVVRRMRGERESIGSLCGGVAGTDPPTKGVRLTRIGRELARGQPSDYTASETIFQSQPALLLAD